MSPQFLPTAACRLSDFSVFTVSGPDAASFLHNQLTNKVTDLAAHQLQRTGYCTPKGRLLAIMLQWKAADDSIGHIIPRELHESTVKRLKMFVLRSKVSFVDHMNDTAIYGLWGSVAADVQVGAVMQLPELPGATLMRTHDCPVLGPRAWLLVNDAQAAAADAWLNNISQRPEAAWRFSEIQSGLPWVWKPTAEAFVPQMVNLELVDGVSFTKGCYPGQEVVARSQYLGKLKRRTFRADVTLNQPNSDLKANDWIGQDVFLSGAAVGRVVDAAQRFNDQGQPQPGLSMLIECSQDDWSKGGIELGGPENQIGHALVAAHLPYEFTVVA
jgi:tRNA-modifying protein YgfZ